MSNVTDITHLLPSTGAQAPPSTNPSDLRIGFGYDGQDNCVRCDSDHGVPVTIGLHLASGERLCTNCAEALRPGYGYMFEALDALDATISEAPDDVQRLVRILEIRRAIEISHGRWLEDDQ